ncbi:hypothetical protein ACUN7V_15265 [Quadrisphaera oryzae]|uniref:hypothetical protein n=1 Tax=Quadrisphaera TaxID=317661 RepID=UPI001648DFF6|nr:hypothetical protein [Quadrisphaera sp. RL12-1S]MBC3760572.1 hypothetical protein [Quadrisphaera sp. RL12-1S]
MERSRRLDDDALAEEIELYGDLVVAASEAGDVLPQAEIDRLLGVPVSGDPARFADHSDDGPDDDLDDGPGGGAGGGAGAPPDRVG